MRPPFMDECAFGMRIDLIRAPLRHSRVYRALPHTKAVPSSSTPLSRTSLYQEAALRQ